MLHYTVEKKEKELWLKEKTIVRYMQKRQNLYLHSAMAILEYGHLMRFLPWKTRGGCLCSRSFQPCLSGRGYRAGKRAGISGGGAFSEWCQDQVSICIITEQYLRRLNIRTGELREKFICTGREGLRVQVEVRRFLHGEGTSICPAVFGDAFKWNAGRGGTDYQN